MPIYGAAHPLGGQPLSARDLAQLQKCGNSLGRHVFDLVDSLGIKAASGLKTLSQEGAWVSLKMEMVGFKEASIMELQQLIETLNREAGDVKGGSSSKALGL